MSAMKFAQCALCWTLAAAWTPSSMPKLGGKAIIGYWGSAADLPRESQLAEGLRRGYNVIAVAFGDTLTPDGRFQIHTNLGDPPTKTQISAQAGIKSSSWQYILSFGGQNAAGPSPTDTNAYVQGFLKTYEAAQEKFGFDGIDIDIETGMGTPLLKAFREIFKELHARNQVISMAPQPLNIDPEEVDQFMASAFNAYVPLVDTTMIDTVTYIATQLYNNAMPLGSLEKYIASMQKGHKIQWEGQALEVNIPSSKFVFGFPAAPGAAPSGPAEPWELPGSSLAAHYRSSPTLMATGGCMTWSIGWDASQGWQWVQAVKGLWDGFLPTTEHVSDSLPGFFLAPYAASSAGAAPRSGGLAVYFWGMPPSSWIQFVSAQPDSYTAEKLLPGNYKYKILNVGGGGTSWDDSTIADAVTFLPSVKQLGYDGVCFDAEVFPASATQFTMSKFLDLFAKAKQIGLVTVLTSTAEGPYYGCDSPNDCWQGIEWENIDYMVPQMYGADGRNYAPKEMDQYATFWKNGGGQGVHGRFPGPKDLTKILWSVNVGTGASMLSQYPFAGGYVEWAFKSLSMPIVV